MQFFVRRVVLGFVVCCLTAGVLVAVPVEPVAAGICYVGSESGYEDVWFSTGDDGVAARVEADAGLTLGVARTGFEWVIPVCVGFGGSLRVTGIVRESVSGAALADEQAAVAVVLAEMQASSQRPVPRIAPAVDESQVVGLETWLAVDPSSYGEVLTVSRSAGDVGVRGTATPVGLVWMFSDGSAVRELRCDGPGVLYSDVALQSLGGPPCGWGWDHTTLVERALMSVVIEYDVSWSSSLGRSGTISGLRGRTLTVVDLVVGEVQTVGVWGDRDRRVDPGLGEPPVLGDRPDCTLMMFAAGECSDFEDPAADWGMPAECAEVAVAAGGFWHSVVNLGRATLSLGGSVVEVFLRTGSVDDVIEAGSGVFETAGGVVVNVVEVGGALWSCGSWAAGELYELLPPELRFLLDLGIGCSKVGVEALQGVWDGVVMAASAVDDFDAFIAEQVDVAMAVKAEVEADPLGFAQTMLGGVFDMELYETNRNQWIGKMTCEAIVIVLSTVFTGGSALVARYGPKIARLFDKLDDLIPDLPGRRDRDRDRDGGVCDNSFPAGTLVLLRDGVYRPIEMITPGELVVTYNADTHVWSQQPVLAQWSAVHTGPMATLTLGDGGTITSTDDHLFWVDNQGAWIEADQVEPGDYLLGPDGVTRVDRLVVHDPVPTTVFELDTATNDNFVAVGGNAGVLVHNDDHEWDPIFEGIPKHDIPEPVKIDGKWVTPAPTNAQDLLERSIPIGPNTDRRVAWNPDTGEFAVFDPSGDGTWHGHTRPWAKAGDGPDPLSQKMQSVLRSTFNLRGNGKPKATSPKSLDEIQKPTSSGDRPTFGCG